MKVTKEKKDSFKPFTLNITFESAKEIESFYAIMNQSTVVDGADFQTFARIIREAIGSVDYSEIHNRLTQYIKNN